MLLNATIKNFSYQKIWHEKLDTFDFDDINALPGKCLIRIQNKTLALSKWVSPKRTRSYPYARIYDTFDSAVKTATIIPIIKDEGLGGERDYLQWDSISLMSLLNIYVILGFYDKAEPSAKKNKITNQKFSNEHIKTELKKLANYQQSALHWNMNQLENLNNLVNLAKNAYEKISNALNIPMHSAHTLENFRTKISQDLNTFMNFSRTKAQNAQNAESLTTQPKEKINEGQKAKITIQNYLGGQYFFTIDEVFLKDGILYLCECKHSKYSLLPSRDDIKDGLLKLMLFKNLNSIENYKNFKVILRLSSDKLKDTFTLPSENLSENPSENLNTFCEKNKLNCATIKMLDSLNLETKANNFNIWINK